MRSRLGWAILATTILGCARYAGPAEDLRFAGADGVELAGTLVLPEGATGPVPGVVLLHGAEPATRSLAYRMHANLFVERGMAVLLYDKRGAGDSQGDHGAATFGQLIEDALAAVAALRRRPEVDAARIGLVGASQSGWLTPEVAERAGGIAFVINKVGPCQSVPETIAWEVYHDLLADGVSDTAARSQVEVFRRLWAYRVTPTPEGEAAVRGLLRAWARRQDSQLPDSLRPVSAGTLEELAYDPGPFLERTVTPMLYVYGSEDVNVPTAQCVERLAALQREGRPIVVHVFEGEGHEIGGLGLRGYRFAEGYGALLQDFAVRHAGAP